jgi:hypothetical protein
MDTINDIIAPKLRQLFIDTHVIQPLGELEQQQPWIENDASRHMDDITNDIRVEADRLWSVGAGAVYDRLERGIWIQ